jgi:hypothetical protein
MSIENLILNPPYKQPDRHYVIDPQGSTGEICDGRRGQVQAIKYMAGPEDEVGHVVTWDEYLGAARQRGVLPHRAGDTPVRRHVDLSLSYPYWLKLGKAIGWGRVIDQ